MVYCADGPNFGDARVGVLVLKEGMVEWVVLFGFMVSLEALVVKFGKASFGKGYEELEWLSSFDKVDEYHESMVIWLIETISQGKSI